MSTASVRGDRTPVTGVVVAAALAATAAFVGLLGVTLEPVAGQLLASRAGLTAGEAWRLLTGPLVHADADHLVRDLPIFAALSWALERRLGFPRFWPLLAAAMIVPTAATLLLQPALDGYLGLSGAINTLLIAFVAVELSARPRRGSAWIALLGVAHLAKLTYEGTTGALLFPLEMADGVAPAPVAHLAGAAVGAIALPWLVTIRRRRTAPDMESLDVTS